MPERYEYGPLIAEREASGTLRFEFNPASPGLLELPADFMTRLAEQVAPLLAGRPRVILDMGGRVGISSRQLGAMIALRKAVGDVAERLPLRGVSEGVEKVLESTRTDKFFEIVDRAKKR